MLSQGSLLNDRYAIKDELGNGLAGCTYLATDLLVPDSLCAIKELAPKHEKGSVAYQHIRKKFQEEARCLRLLEGYNGQIPRLLDEFPANDTLYIVQEYIEGDTLQSLIDREIIDQSKVRDLLVSLLKVVVYVHSKDILHRDIKPTNIILRAGTEIPVLIDFGSVKDLEMTQVGSSVDISQLAFMSKGYTAPEQVLGEAVPASDIYSLGKTAVHVLSGTHPKKLADGTWRRQVKGLLPEFGEVIDKAINPSHAQRYQQAAEMLAELKKLVFSEDAEKIVRHRVIVVARRPKPFPPVNRKCGDCRFVLTNDDEFCPNCGEYNVLQLNRANFLLCCDPPERYFDEIVRPKMTREDQILLDIGARHRQRYRLDYYQGRNLYHWLDEEMQNRLWRFVSEFHNDILSYWIFVNKTRIEIVAIVPAALFWTMAVFSIGKNFELTPTVYWLIPIICLTMFTLIACDGLAEFYKLTTIRKLYRLQNELHFDREQVLNALEIEKGNLRKKLAERTKAERQRKRDLKARERFINDRINNLASWIGELKSLLTEISDERLADNDLRHQHALRLKAKVQHAGQIQKQYQSKKLEIGLLRLNNDLQRDSNVAEMSYELRTSIKKKLKEVIESCNKMSTDLQEADLAEGSESLRRVLEIGKIASRLWQSLIGQDIELALPGRTSDRSKPAPEFVRNLALLNAYVCLDDFSSELDKLEREFAGARVSGSLQRVSE